jgi:uncharacterized low-complexity protein
MSQKLNKNTFALAVGATALAGSMAVATANPFEMNQLPSGYQLGAQGEMGAKGSEGMCGEGKCGAAMMDADKDGKVTKEEFMAAHEKMFAEKDKNSDGVLDADELKAGEGKCGEGKCGGDKAAKAGEGKCGEGKCGGDKAAKAGEGKCGEGKCGGAKTEKAGEGKCGEGKCGSK